MLVEAIAAGVVGAALLWYVLQPILGTYTAAPFDRDPIDVEETPRGRALLALKEIEFDRATGKLSDADFDALNARYSAAAIAALDEQSPSPHCMIHGPRNQGAAHFCSDCGAGLLTALDACVQCAAFVPADARFCPGCGVAVRIEP